MPKELTRTYYAQLSDRDGVRSFEVSRTKPAPDQHPIVIPFKGPDFALDEAGEAQLQRHFADRFLPLTVEHFESGKWRVDGTFTDYRAAESLGLDLLEQHINVRIRTASKILLSKTCVPDRPVDYHYASPRYTPKISPV